MVLAQIATIGSQFPTEYAAHVFGGLAAIFTIRAFSQGRFTTRERTLHGRVVLLTGGFTSLGVTVLQNLAQRGAHVIALTDQESESELSPIKLIIEALRTTTKNENIFAETCDLTSAESIHAFHARFAQNQDTRLDAILFMHEYPLQTQAPDAQLNGSMATFLLTTLLLPVVLTAPVERDIRIINVVNPLYAASARTLFSDTRKDSKIVTEGKRALRTVVFTRHLQRVLDALPAAAMPEVDEHSSSIPVVSPSRQRSNIAAISVSPGFGRSDIISVWLGTVLSFLLFPITVLFFKSNNSAMQSILHALFLPTPFKAVGKEGSGGEVLKPGALYAECSVVKLSVVPPTDDDKKSGGKEATEQLPDDGELGGEVAGRTVWELYEAQLKVWEKEWKESQAAHKLKEEEEQKRTTS